MLSPVTPGTVSIENKVVCCLELLFSLLPAPTSQKSFIWRVFAQVKGVILNFALLQLWSEALAWPSLCFPPRWAAAGWERLWLFSMELTIHPASHLCPNRVFRAIYKAAFPNLIFFTSRINFQALQEFILLPGMETLLSADTFALNVSDVCFGMGLA